MHFHFYDFRPDWVYLTDPIDQDRFYWIMAYQDIEMVEFYIGASGQDTNIAYVRVKKNMGIIGSHRSHYSLWATEVRRVLMRLRDQIQEQATLAEQDLNYYMNLAAMMAVVNKRASIFEEDFDWGKEGF